MFDSDSIIVGLEIGTSKVCAMVGEVADTGEVSIIGVGQARSRGVRKGEVSDAAAVQEDVRTAIAEAEGMANVEIRSAYLGVSGGHLRSFTNRGVHPIVSADREITEEDVQDVLKNAKVINLPAQNVVVHAIRQNFIVDGRENVQNPVGMAGERLEVDVHVIHGNQNRFSNAARAVKALQIEVENVCFTGLAASLAVLNSEEKEVGALVVDFGGGTTEYVLYHGGIVKHSGVIAVGGDHVSNDLAVGLKVPLSRAEQLKLEHGSVLLAADATERTVDLPSETGRPWRSLKLDHLQKIMEIRVEETLTLIANDLRQQGLFDCIGSGVFLCGGCARMAGLQSLVEDIFDTHAFLGRAQAMSGIRAALDQPEFAAPIGLVKFGSLQQRRRAGGLIKNFRETFGSLFQRT